MPISILVSQGLIIVGALIYSFSYIWVNAKRKNLASAILKFKPSNPKSSAWILISSRKRWIDKRESWLQIVSIVIFATGLIWRYFNLASLRAIFARAPIYTISWIVLFTLFLFALILRFLELFRQLKAAKRR